MKDSIIAEVSKRIGVPEIIVDIAVLVTLVGILNLWAKVVT